MSSQPSGIQLRRIVDGAIRSKRPLNFNHTVAKVEKTFRIKAGKRIRRELMQIYDEVRHQVAQERKRSAGLKLIVIGGFFSLLAAFFFINQTYDLPIWLKIAFLVIGVPAWFLGLQTLFSPPRTQPLPREEEEDDGVTEIIED